MLVSRRGPCQIFPPAGFAGCEEEPTISWQIKPMQSQASIAIETSCRQGGLALGRGQQLVQAITFDARGRCATHLVWRLRQLVSDNGRLCFQRDSVRITVPPSKAETLQTHGVTGGKTVLGVRPEDIGIAGARAEWNDRGWDVPAEVTVVEPLGDEMIVYIRVAETDMLGKVDSHHRVKHGQSLTVQFNMDQAHFFSTETGKNVSLR